MTHPLTDQVLSDWIDGALSDEAEAALERHLSTCHSCRATAERWRHAVDRLRSAPRAIQPGHDLWPSLQRRVAGEAGSGKGRARPAAWWSSPTRLVAAALLLVALSSGLTAYVLGRTGPSTAAVAARSDEPAPRSPLAEESAYRHIAAQLFESYTARRDELAPETVDVVERSLDVIDEAIAEARAALARDPANRAVADMLEATYRHKIDFLRRTAELPSRS